MSEGATASTEAGEAREGSHTPLIQQYLDIKDRHPDAMVFFRVGDFYEMFFDDAHEASRLLGITLTARNNGASADVPMAGVPVKAVEEYLPELLRRGRRVAVAEQVEDADQADGLVEREVVEVVTPGTTLEDTLLSEKQNNFVAAVVGEDPVGIAMVDVSTGEFEAWECPADALRDELGRLEPSEVVVPGDFELSPSGGWVETRREAWRFERDFAEENLRRAFDVKTVEGFGFRPDGDGALVRASGALVGYLEEVRPGGVDHLRPPRIERRGRYMHLDEMTRRNLELVEPLMSDRGTSLLAVLDRTRTAMGGRLLRRWLLHPLLDREEILRRQEAVAELTRRGDLRSELRDRLARVRDLERLAGKLSTARAGPRQILGLADSLEELPPVRRALADPQSEAPGADEAGSGRGAADAGSGGPESGRLRELAAMDPLEDVRGRVRDAVDPEAPPKLGEGGVIREGFSEELDELRETRDGAVEFIARLQAEEREKTGISSLKVGHNKVFGYYLEVTNPNLDRVPDRYHRKQTLSNSERYFTPELKEWEEKVVGAEERIEELELRLFRELRESLAAEASRIQETARKAAELDVLSTLADVAVRNGYSRPEVAEDFRLELRAARHPVVEQTMAREDFIPNDVVLDRDGFLMILTGPNMAGKSTVLRQVGLAALLAQIGSFVPAEEAHVGLCDRIFTRVGASDNLARGQSTFMVEMTETATILNSATDRSLVLLDEIGRGTSTYDGVSIAWAVTEHIHDEVGARTIFATHYHELVELADRLDGVTAFNVAVRETGDDIVFLRRLEPGGCDRSYGVHVGRLAGLPPEVVARANQVLRELENGPDGTGSRLSRLNDRTSGQLTLFETPDPEAVRRLREMDPERMTPLEALNALAELRALVPEEGDGGEGAEEGGGAAGGSGSERRRGGGQR